MAPRPVGEIISTLLQSEEEEKKIVVNFCNVVEELYTHPRNDVNNMLIKIKDKDIFSIRDDLFLRCLDILEAEKFQQSKLYIHNSNPLSNLRKRYKVDKCYDDIYIIAISIIEK